MILIRNFTIRLFVFFVFLALLFSSSSVFSQHLQENSTDEAKNVPHTVDTTKSKGEHDTEKEGNFDIIERVVDHDYVDFYFLGQLPLPQFEPIQLGGLTIDMSVTKSMFMMLVSSIIIDYRSAESRCYQY